MGIGPHLYSSGVTVCQAWFLERSILRETGGHGVCCQYSGSGIIPEGWGNPERTSKSSDFGALKKKRG
eukprot:118305-Hanusia_phi.AAC.1